MDELVKQHPDIDEKALRRGYAQVKSKAGKSKPAGKKKASKKAGKKPAAANRSVAQSRGAAAPPSPPVDPDAPKYKADPEVRRFIIRRGIDAIKLAIAELES